MIPLRSLLWIEAKQYKYTLATLWMALGFYFLYLFLFQIGLQDTSPPTRATILWVGFLLVQLLYAPLWFKENNQQGCLFDLYILGGTVECFLTAKFLFYCCVQWVTFLLYFLLAAAYWGFSAYLCALLLISLGIAVPIVSSLLMVLNIALLKGQQSFSLLALLLFPLILPTLIVALVAIKSVHQAGEENFFYFVVAELGILLLTIPSCFLCATYLLKETLETV